MKTRVINSFRSTLFTLTFFSKSILFIGILGFGVTPCVAASIKHTEASDVELQKAKLMLGQKMILDFRYFCQDETPANHCRTPVTSMPQPLLNLLGSENIGGVILFSENIRSAKGSAFYRS